MAFHVYLFLLDEVGGRRGIHSMVPWQLNRPFPTAPSRTRRAPFDATGSPGLRRASALTAYPRAVRGLHRTVADVLTAQFPFPVYQALLRSCEYYGNSVTLRVSPLR
jgi:hypothetical protein